MAIVKLINKCSGTIAMGDMKRGQLAEIVDSLDTGEIVIAVYGDTVVSLSTASTWTELRSGRGLRVRLLEEDEIVELRQEV